MSRDENELNLWWFLTDKVLDIQTYDSNLVWVLYTTLKLF
jgi:hypothetical protein